MASRVALAGVLVLAACGERAVPQQPLVEAPDRHDSPTSGTTEYVRAAKVTVRTVDGQSVTVPDAQGRPMALFFMASWCLSCVRVAALFNDVHAQYRDRGFQVLAIDMDPNDTPDDLARFRELAGDPKYLWAIDKGQRATRAYGVRSLDAAIVIDGQGFVRFRSEGMPEEGELRRAVAALFR